MANLSSEELKKIKALLLEQASIQKKLNEETGGYEQIIKDIKNLHKDIALAKGNMLKQEQLSLAATKAFNDAISSGNKLTQTQYNILKKTKDLEDAKLGILRDEVIELERATAAMVKQAKEATNIRNVFGSIKKDLVGITSNIKQNYSKFKAWSGTFEIDKSIRMSATQMGILSKQTDGFRDSLDKAGQQTASFGVGISELAKMQADYSEELGRTVMLGQTGLEAMAQMAKATGLGAEGASKMASDMENQGYSAERTAEYMEQTLADSTKLGLNASKVIKNMQGNMKQLNKYNFKDGAKGFAKMAETVTKLGVSMNVVEGMAEKLFDIEGAVDMTAQLQVMGGAWAKLADPFKLMYMARNDMEGLTVELGKAAEASVHFNKESGAFEISSLEMHKLRKIAEQTGVAYEDLASAGKNAAKFTKIKNQLSFNVDKETKEFLESTAKIDKNGNAIIEINGDPKLIKTMTSADIGLLKAGIAEKKSLKDRAEASQTFDEKLTNVVLQLKQFLLPFVNALDKGLRPIVQSLTNTMSNPKLLEGIKSAAETAGKVIGVIGKFVANNPATAIVGALAGFGIMEAVKWYANGKALGMGFNSVANAGGGGAGDVLDMVGGKKMKGLRSASKIGKFAKGWGGAGAGLLSAGMSGYNEFSENSEAGMSTGENAGRTALRAGAAGGGAWGGVAGGAAIGTLILPGVGTALGALIGGIAGGMAGDKIGDIGGDLAFGRTKTAGVHDGIFGKDFSQGRSIVQGGKITPIDNKDDLMAYKPNGPIDKHLSSAGSNSSGTMKIEFGDIHFKFDELKVTSPGSPGLSIDLLKDQNFIRSITRMVHSETEKVINGGMNKG